MVTTMLINYECNLRCKRCSVQENLDKLSGPRRHAFTTWQCWELEKKFEEGARVGVLRRRGAHPMEGRGKDLWRPHPRGEKGLGTC